ncbi:levanase [Cohnella sp. CFH 77786]|uniref:GH32 C-terminal domain-containing protein n=1 Tax=Cohnella sp. CFH 77786 TaxID=2662265 RepID=UPI001C60CAD9|nr:GH32 C-terminal domain-containing protein [Cohnella sp. CFH 77786]MBW5449230.1 levanase [Cohnella sp. CFH 77786]
MRKNSLILTAGVAAAVLIGFGATILMTGRGTSTFSEDGSGFPYSSDPNYYTELYRPQYHLSPPYGNMSDPNGMVYFEGEYHQFYQNSGQWGHAVSRDLIHWEHLPVALVRDSLGEIWSGSAVVDREDTSGFFDGKEGLVAIFTHFKGGVQSQSIAYSKDKGRTWTKYVGNPVIPNPGLKDFRDPKVFWHKPSKSWVMVVAVDNRVRFYTSPDLKAWRMASEFGSDQGSHAAVWECPDLFELPLEGTKEKRWVLTVSIGSNEATKGSTAQYFVGSFDGTTFTNDNKPSDVLWTDYGKDFYAAVSYSDIPANDGRRIWLGWMSNWRYPFAMPTEPWKGNMSIPRELKLRQVEGQGLRMIQQPIEELQSLRGKEVVLPEQLVVKGHNPFAGIKGTSYELETELTVTPNAKFTFNLRQGDRQATRVSYDASTGQLTVDRTQSGVASFEKDFPETMSAPVRLNGNKLKLRFFVDESSAELFANDGETVFSNLIFPDPTSSGLELTAEEGGVTLNEAHYYPMRSVWRDEDPDGLKPLRIVFGKDSLDVPVDESRKMTANVLPYNSPQQINWEISDAAIAAVETAEDGVIVKGLMPGSAEVKATSIDGNVIATFNIFVYDNERKGG